LKSCYEINSSRLLLTFGTSCIPHASPRHVVIV